MTIPVPFACWVLAGSAGAASGEEARVRALADRCGSQIDWIRDVLPAEDGGKAFEYLRGGKRLGADLLDQGELGPKELRACIEKALVRAREERRLVLWHVWRFEGGHMYRAPNLDDYMDQVPWSDPAVVQLVSTQFIPLRTRCSREVGKEFGLLAWDVVEPALVFLTPDGKVAHAIDRIRTFDPRWFAEVLRRVLAAHPDLDPPDPDFSVAAAFTTLDAATLEATRNDYYEGLTAYLSGKERAGLSRWQELVESQPESPFAWRAAANLATAPDKTWPGAARHFFEWPFGSWVPPDGSIPKDTRWRRTPADAESVAENGVRWLLRTQRADGSWNDCRYAYWDTPLITPNAWMAITAVCASALTAWRDLAPEEVDAALARAEEYMFREGRVNAGRNEEIYAHAYRIDYLLRTLAATEDEGQRNGLVEQVKGLVDKLAGMQSQAGMWAHEYDNAFCTAVALDAFAKAKEHGVLAPDPVVNRGLEALAAARYSDGSFVYGGRLGAGATPHAEQLKDACGRMPMCEAALFAWERSDTRNLVKALVTYQQYFDRFEKISKCDFHTDGELGGFFFLHDLYHSSEAVLRLPPAGQKGFRRFLVEKITALPEIDGSFLDDHEVGKSCGTGYALLALRNALHGPDGLDGNPR